MSSKLQVMGEKKREFSKLVNINSLILKPGRISSKVRSSVRALCIHLLNSSGLMITIYFGSNQWWTYTFVHFAALEDRILKTKLWMDESLTTCHTSYYTSFMIVLNISRQILVTSVCVSTVKDQEIDIILPNYIKDWS